MPPGYLGPANICAIETRQAEPPAAIARKIKWCESACQTGESLLQSADGKLHPPSPTGELCHQI